MKRSTFFAMFAVVAVLAATVSPDLVAATMDPGALALGAALGMGALMGDIQLVRSKELRAQRATLVDANGKLLAKIDAEKDQARVKELEAEWDARDKDIEKLTAQILRAERQEVLEAEGAAPAQERRSGRQMTQLEQQSAEERHKAYRAAFLRYLQFGHQGLESDELKVLRMGYARADGGRVEGRDGMTTTNAAGGYTIPTDLFRSLQESLLAYGGARQTATIITTDSGNTLNIPTVDDTTAKAAIVGEGVSLTSPTDVTFGVVAMSAFMYRSVVPITYELMQDSAFDMEAWIRSALVTRLGRGTNVHFTYGNGSTQPKGFMSSSSSGKTAASATDVAYNDLVDLYHSVDPAYRTGPMVKWTFADGTLKILKKIKDSQNRPLWLPGLAVREPDTILGSPYVINQDMAAVAASNRSIAFGDFSKFWIRDVRNPLILRNDAKAMDQATVLFYLFSRHDSDTMDAGTDPFKHLTHPSPD